jgi:hypothetical protein
MQQHAGLALMTVARIILKQMQNTQRKSSLRVPQFVFDKWLSMLQSVLPHSGSLKYRGVFTARPIRTDERPSLWRYMRSR